MNKYILIVFWICANVCLFAHEFSLMPKYYTTLAKKIFAGKNTNLWGAIKTSANADQIRISWDLNGDGVYEIKNETVRSRLKNNHYYFEKYCHYTTMALHKPKVKLEINNNGWQTIDEKQFQVLVCPEDYLPGKIRSAILDGLRYLYKSQNSNGSWNSNYNFPPNGNGLIVLAFENEGFLPKMSFADSPFIDTVKNGLKFLENYCKTQSDFTTRNRCGYTLPMTCLAFIGSQDQTYLKYVKDISAALISSQQTDGGWGYTVNQRSDSSITHWAPTALIYAREIFGVKIPNKTKKRLLRWYQSVYSDGYCKYRSTSHLYKQEQLGLIGGLLFSLYCIDQKFLTNQNQEVRKMYNGAIKILAQQWKTIEDSKNAYNYYAISRSLKTLSPQVNFLTNGNKKFKWFPSLSKKIIEMNTEVSGRLGTLLYWTNHQGIYLPTALNILSLQPYVLKHRPIASLSENSLSVVQGQPITLDASQSWHSLDNKKIVSYEWDLDNNKKYIEMTRDKSMLYIWGKTRRNGKKVGTKDNKKRHVLSKYFNEPGKEYVVNLRVSDEDGVRGEDSIIIKVDSPEIKGHPPVVYFEGDPFYGFAGRKFQIDVGNAYDPDVGEHINYEKTIWDTDGDGIFEESMGSRAVNIASDFPTEKWIGVEVYSTSGEKTQKYVLTKIIHNHHHTVDIKINEKPKEGDFLDFILQLEDQDLKDTHNIQWELKFNNKSIIKNKSNLKPGSHKFCLEKIKFIQDGDYILNIIVEDILGINKVSLSKRIRVQNVLPNVSSVSLKHHDDGLFTIDFSLEDLGKNDQIYYSITCEDSFSELNRRKLIKQKYEKPLRLVLEFDDYKKEYEIFFHLEDEKGKKATSYKLIRK